MFREGREQVTDEDRVGRPSTSKNDTVARVRSLLNSDRRMSVRLLSNELGVPKTIVHEIISEKLQMRKVCAKLVPKVLSDEQEANRVATSLCSAVTKIHTFCTTLSPATNPGYSSMIQKQKRQSEEWHTAASPKKKKRQE